MQQYRQENNSMILKCCEQLSQTIKVIVLQAGTYAFMNYYNRNLLLMIGFFKRSVILFKLSKFPVQEFLVRLSDFH